MAIALPNTFAHLVAGGAAEIVAESIFRASTWTQVLGNDHYLRSELCRRRTIDWASVDAALQLDNESLSTTRFWELARSRVGLSPGRTGAEFDYDIFECELRVAHAHISELTAVLGVIAGGTGYTNADVLTLVGGTGTAATVTVTGVSSGIITSVAPTMTTPGDYTAFPRSAIVGYGADIIVSGGSGYIATEWVTVVGGTGTAAAFRVGTVDGNGAITSFDARTVGDYTVSPRETVATTSSVSGTGCTLLLDWGDSATRYVTVRDGTGNDDAVLNVSRRINTSLSITTGASRVDGTLAWPTLLETAYDIIIEARNTVAPGNADIYAMRYRELAITLADL